MAQKKNSSMASVVRSSFKMAMATFISRILGLVRELAMAWKFGASGMTDAFMVAYRIPNMLRDLFAEGAFSSSFVPVFSEVKIQDPMQARRLLWSLFILLGSITTLISLIIIIFAPFFAALLTSGDFLADPLRAKVTIELIRVMAPFLVFVSLAALFMGALNSLRIFFVPALAPAFFNIVMILSIIFLPSYVQQQGYHPIFALGVGVFFGGLIQMLFQIPMLIKVAYGPVGSLSLFNKYTKQIIERLGVGTIGIAANQINLIITTILATSTVLGAVSWLTYAFRLFQFPVGILGVSIANSNLVHFSDAWKSGKKQEAVDFLKSGCSLSFLVMFLAFGLLMGLADQSVNFVFERGAFSSHDTQMASLALKMYLLGLPFYGLYKILAPTFFALDRPEIPVFISVFAIIVNIIFCILMVPHFGFSVLALGTSLSMILNILLQISILRRLIAINFSDFVGLSFFKAALAATVTWYAASWLGSTIYQVDGAIFEKFFALMLSFAFGLIVYLLCMWPMGELKRFLSLFKRKAHEMQ